MIIEQPSFERAKGPIKLPKTEKKVQPVEKVGEVKELSEKDAELYRKEVEKKMGKGNKLDEKA
ncbi:MAG: hypothetical protein AAB454_00215 [Patescibacteria group bacterium]